MVVGKGLKPIEVKIINSCVADEVGARLPPKSPQAFEILKSPSEIGSVYEMGPLSY